VETLRQVEDEVRPLLKQPGHEASIILEWIGVHPAPRERRCDRLWHAGKVELLEAIIGRRGDENLGKAAVDDGRAEAHDP
jgi:hypothetical protein